MAFLRLMLGATTNDVKTQVAALRDLGALPMDTDLDAVIADLRLDQPPIDPTTLTGDELVKEVQRVVKALLEYGARMPKELMLYVKNMVFLDGAIARLAPDLDILAEIANISMLFAQRHGERLGAELGIDHNAIEINLDGVKASFGLESSADAAHLPGAPTAPRADPEAHALPHRPLDPPTPARRRRANRHVTKPGSESSKESEICTDVRAEVCRRCRVGYRRGRHASRDRPLLRRLRRPPVGPPPRGGQAAHGEGRRLRRHPCRRWRLQAAQLDERTQPADRGGRPVDRRQPEG